MKALKWLTRAFAGPLSGVARLSLGMLLAGLGFIQCGCEAPMGADKVPPILAYQQIHDNPVSHRQLSPETRSAIYRFQQSADFERAPDETLRLIQDKAVETRERSLLFALAELNYLAGERLRGGVKPWETRDARDYYLASAVYAWLFLLGDAADGPPGPFDQRFRTACDLYNYGLGWALTERRSTNATAILAGGERRLPFGKLDVEFKQTQFPWPLADFERFVLGDQFLVRGLSMRNRQRGLGAPLVGISKEQQLATRPRMVPSTVVLRVEGGLAELAQGRLRASLELYSAYDASVIQVGDREVPLETDTTVAMAYALNQSWLWDLGMAQFLSGEERVPSDVYLTQPYRPGRVPVVFVHGTFSSPIWWAEMVNSLAADPVLRQRFQFWYFIYNSGSPLVYSSSKLREALKAKVKELDPEGNDAALQQMVVVGHSQGGLLTKLTACNTGDRLLEIAFKTNRLEELKVPPEQLASIRRYACFDALPFVKRVVFISTPHRGSYLASNLARNLARRFVTLTPRMLKQATELAGLRDKLKLPRELRGAPTSLDSMSPSNPYLLALADMPLAPGVIGHSVIAVQGNGDYHQGKDGLVDYKSACIDYVESEFIVRSHHSCQDKPPTIEEVRRILHKHLSTLPRIATN